MNIFFKIVKILFKTKILFFVPHKKKILIYDRQNSEYLTRIFNKNDLFILDTRKETINIYVLFILLFGKRNFTYRNYLITYISILNPNLIITYIDNNHLFYDLKNYFKDKCFMSIQSGNRYSKTDLFDLFKKKKENCRKRYKADKIFVLSDTAGKEYQKYISCDYITIGSFKNNFFKIKKSKKNKVIAFISKFRGQRTNQSINNSYYSTYMNSENNKLDILKDNFYLNLLKKVMIYCEKKKFKLKIFGFSKKNKVIEKNYYKKVLKNKNFWTFHERQDMATTTKNIDKCEIIVDPMSTLGIEAISRKKKVGFFFLDALGGSNFGWPLLRKKKGLFYTNSSKYNEVERVLDNLSHVTSDKWNKIIRKYYKKSFYYDYKNSKFKKLLKEQKYI